MSVFIKFCELVSHWYGTSVQYVPRRFTCLVPTTFYSSISCHDYGYQWGCCSQRLELKGQSHYVAWFLWYNFVICVTSIRDLNSVFMKLTHLYPHLAKQNGNLLASTKFQQFLAYFKWHFMPKIGWPNQTLEMVQIKMTFNEDDLKILKVEYLSSHWLDPTQIWNISRMTKFKFTEISIEDDSKGRWTQNVKSGRLYFS